MRPAYTQYVAQEKRTTTIKIWASRFSTCWTWLKTTQGFSSRVSFPVLPNCAVTSPTQYFPTKINPVSKLYGCCWEGECAKAGAKSSDHAQLFWFQKGLGNWWISSQKYIKTREKILLEFCALLGYHIVLGPTFCLQVCFSLFGQQLQFIFNVKTYLLFFLMNKDKIFEIIYFAVFWSFTKKI